MRVLTVNTGSSSAKLRVLDERDDVVRTADATPAGVGRSVSELLDECPVDAVGHRVVHGGPRHVQPEVVGDALVEELRQLVDLAPLHQPLAIEAIEAVRRETPTLPAVACFDTAFHADLPEAARTYAVPRAWRERHGLRRYGFHGLSYAWASRQAGQLLGRDDLRLVVAHLGSGASLAAIKGARSLDTTMGFTPLEGLVMATRAGTVDPGLLLWLIERGGLTVAEVVEGVDRHGGLLALAGTKEMREVLERAARGDTDANLALGVYVHRLAAQVAAMTAALGGIDALVFTGGVGERSAPVRQLLVERLGYLGLGTDDPANNHGIGDRDISEGSAAARVLVVSAREDIEIARGVRTALGSAP